MNAETNPENLAVAEAAKPSALALLTLSPEVYVAEVYQPFKDKLAAAIDSLRTINYDIATTAGMATATKARALVKGIRTGADNERKDRKAPIIKIGKLLESGFDDVEARVLPLEEMFDADIKAEEKRKEDARLTKIAAELARVETIQAMIRKIQGQPLTVAGKSAAEIAAWFDAENPDRDFDFMEFSDAAADAIAESMIIIRSMLTKAQDVERIAAELEAARLAELERIEAARVENDRVAAENARVAAAQAAEAQRLADIAKAQQEAAAQAQREADARAQAERDEQAKKAAAQQAIIDAQLKAMAEQKAALEAQQAAADARDAEALAEQQRNADHPEALMMNAEFDVARDAAEAERQRLQALAVQAADDARDPAPSLEVLMDDVPPTVELSDAEIIDMVGAAFDLTRAEAIDRLQAIDFDAARAG